MSVNLLESNNIFSIKNYPKAFDYWNIHEKAHWLFDEVPLTDDMIDFWNADKREKDFLENILRLFTQNDIEVGDGYDVLLRIFKPLEIKMMLRGFSSREVTHIMAYSHFTETIGFDDSFYSEFKEIPQMNCKVEYLEKCKVRKYEFYEEEHKRLEIDSNVEDYIRVRYKQDTLRMLGAYATGTEGISLFAQFAMLLKYQTINKYKGLANLVEWSIRDEEIHVQGNSFLFREFVKENPEILTDEVKKDIYGSIRQIVRFECDLIDYLNPPHLSKEDCKNYVKYIANERLKLIGFKPNWEIKKNPFSFMEELNNSLSLTNFFEGKVTEYTKNSLVGNWEHFRNNENFIRQYSKI